MQNVKLGKTLVPLFAVSASIAGAGSCASSSTTCATDTYGNYVCDTYAYAYPYTYDYYLDSYYYYPYYPSTVYYYLTAADGGATGSGSMGVTSGETNAPDASTSAVPELLAKARLGADTVNAGVAEAMNPVVLLVKTRPNRSGDTLTYGPIRSGSASYVFTVKKLSNSNKSFSWELRAKQQSSGEDLKTVAGGTIDVSNDSPPVTRSTLGVDGDALAAADSSLRSQGTLLLGASDDGTTNVLRFRLKGFTPDSTRADAVDAAAIGVRHGQDQNELRVVLKTNLEETKTDAQELVIVKLDWRQADGARADAIAVGGDIPQGQELQISTCVPASLDPASASTVSVTCDVTDTSCTSSSSELMCPAAFQSDMAPNPDPTADDAPADAPTLPQVPTSIPE
ncbi:MAG TPA: hypothetical protein VHC69_32200 [Polyangiaceae bacterium]|nr:hypothetical protein [Polyangiaceae bacterium]